MTAIRTDIDDVTVDRASGMGGSDISAVVGLNPWKGPHEVWGEKVGIAPPVEENEPMRWGKLHEEIIARQYAQQHGVKLARSKRLLHPRYPWAFGTPDRLVRGMRKILEIKTAGHFQRERWGTPGTDQIPDEYVAQVQWYLEIIDYEEADVPALFGGNKLEVYHVTRERELGATLLARAERFWFDHVIPRVPPPIDGSASALRMLDMLYPHDRAPMIHSTPELDAWAFMLRDARAQQREIDRVVREARANLEAGIGDAAGLIGSWGKITWKRAKGRARTDWQAIAENLMDEWPDEQRAAQIAEYTATGAGGRPFSPRFTKEEDEVADG